MIHSATESWPRRVAILGVGLLGGSVALSLRRVRPTTTFVGYARSAEKCQLASGSGVVDVAFDSIEMACDGCDVVVVAGPVDQIAPLAIRAAAACPPDCLITDVGSTKAAIVRQVQQDPRAAKLFVAAHPIAGSEKSGSLHAQATLFDGKTIVLTPADDSDPELAASDPEMVASDPEMVERAEHFWQLTGGQTRQMSPQDHDTHLASVSHVPHLVSALVARMVRPESRPLVGSGWHDITRVAAGDPAMWTAICQHNRAAVTQELQRLAGDLDTLRQILADQDDQRLTQWLAEAQQMKQQSQ